MDLVLAESNDNMINSLQFGLPESAAYVTDRKQVHFPSVSGNIFSSSNGNKYLKFVITGEDNNYIDLSSVCLFFDVVNTSTTAGEYLRPLGESHAFFTRYRCNAAGQQINDIDNYNQVCEQMKSFKSEEVRNLDDIQEGCLTRYDSRINRLFAYTIESHDATATAGSNQRGAVLPKLTRLNTTGIEQGKFVRMGHKPVCGFVQSGYYPPIRYCPLEFIFEIVSDAGEPVIRPATPVAGTQAEDDENGLYFTTRNTTTSWSIQNCILRCELIQVDNTVNNNIVSHLLKGGRLRMVYPAYYSFSQTFTAGNTEINMNIVKSSTRLSQMFFTFSNSNINNDNTAGNYDRKRWNYFFHPMAVTIDNLEGVIDSDKQISAQIQIANKKFPEQEISSISEFMYFLRRAVNVMSPYYDGFSIDIYRYANDKFIGGINFDKQPDMNFTGSNTKMGSLITFKIKGANANFALGIERVFITAVSEQIFELSESASTVLD